MLGYVITLSPKFIGEGRGSLKQINHLQRLVSGRGWKRGIETEREGEILYV